jgi:hypothetical protein
VPTPKAKGNSSLEVALEHPECADILSVKVYVPNREAMARLELKDTA